MKSKTSHILRKIAADILDEAMANHQAAVNRAEYRNHNGFAYSGHSPMYSQIPQPTGSTTQADWVRPSLPQQLTAGAENRPNVPEADGGMGIGGVLAGLGLIGGAAWLGSKLWPGSSKGRNTTMTQNTSTDVDPNAMRKFYNSDEQSTHETVTSHGARALGYAALPAAHAAGKAVTKGAIRALKLVNPAKAGLLAGKMGARVGSKFIPGVGWALALGELGQMGIELGSKAYAKKQLKSENNTTNEFGETEYRAGDADLRKAYDSMGASRRKLWESKGGFDVYRKAMLSSIQKAKSSVDNQRAKGTGRGPADNFAKDDGLGWWDSVKSFWR